MFKKYEMLQTPLRFYNEKKIGWGKKHCWSSDELFLLLIGSEMLWFIIYMHAQLRKSLLVKNRSFWRKKTLFHSVRFKVTKASVVWVEVLNNCTRLKTMVTIIGETSKYPCVLSSNCSIKISCSFLSSSMARYWKSAMEVHRNG